MLTFSYVIECLQSLPWHQGHDASEASTDKFSPEIQMDIFHLMVSWKLFDTCRLVFLSKDYAVFELISICKVNAPLIGFVYHSSSSN
jgi:hypothetical protein